MKKGERVYEYQTPDGKIFWSYERLPNLTTSVLRMVLQSTIGVHVNNFVHAFKLRGLEIQKREEAKQDAD